MPYRTYFFTCVRCGLVSANGFDGHAVDVLGGQRRFGGINNVQHYLACFWRAVPRPLIERGDGESAHRVGGESCLH